MSLEGNSANLSAESSLSVFLPQYRIAFVRGLGRAADRDGVLGEEISHHQGAFIGRGGRWKRLLAENVFPVRWGVRGQDDSRVLPVEFCEPAGGWGNVREPARDGDQRRRVSPLPEKSDDVP